MRAVDLLRLLIGVQALLAPRAVARVLGARQVAQSLVVARTGWRTLSAGVDLAHAGSMLVPLVIAPRRTGRFALSQIATAALLAALELSADQH